MINEANYIGKKYHHWTVLSLFSQGKKLGVKFNCVCKCGIERVVKKQSLDTGQSKSCGCRELDLVLENIEKLKSKKFSRWKVTSYAGQGKNGVTRVKTGCECGKEKELPLTAITTGKSKSCGCLAKELTSLRATTHGATGTPTHDIWSGMLDRTHRKNKAVKEGMYWRVGIGVCDSWLKFENFLKDMGERPSPKHSLDRIDGTKGYSPENCRWVTWKVQSNNRPGWIRKIKFEGIEYTIEEASIKFNLPQSTIRCRIFQEWPDDVICTWPLRKHYNGRKKKITS